MAEVLRITDPRLLLNPEIGTLFVDAFHNSPVFLPLEEMVEDVANLVTDPNAAVLVAAEGSPAHPVGLVIILFPTNKLNYLPQILHFYSRGSSASRKILISKGLELIQERGYVRFLAVNATGKADSVWARLWRVPGRSKHVGGIVEFNVSAAPPLEDAK